MKDQPADETDRRFAENFRAAREQAGLSQREVADRMRERGYAYHQQTIVRVESGSQSPRVGEATALAAIVDRTVDALTRPPELAREAQEILAAARAIRQRSREMTVLARRQDDDTARLRRLLDDARRSGIAGALRTEIRLAVAALAESMRESGHSPVDNAIQHDVTPDNKA